MGTYPRDMKVVETISDDELIQELGRRASKRGGGMVISIAHDVQGNSTCERDGVFFYGGVIRALGLAHNAVRRITNVLDADKVQEHE